jgi:hypothetical protein
MNSRHLGLVAGAEMLYERVVTSPEAWNDGAFEEWTAEILSDGPAPSRDVAREIRRCVRAAVKLRGFWLAPPAGVPSDAGDWRTRVDLALGIRAWRPLLGIAQAGLAEAPSEEVFHETQRLFREVHAATWMDGVTFEVWQTEHAAQP